MCGILSEGKTDADFLEQRTGNDVAYPGALHDFLLIAMTRV
jgi:hypothetical protein